MAFYLFSFHVHEKHIILPLIFFGLAINEFKHFFSMLVNVASWSMLGMIKLERNTSTIIGLMLGFHYFVRKLEALMLNSFRIDTPQPGIIVYNESIKLTASESHSYTRLGKFFVVYLRNIVCSFAVIFFILLFIVDSAYEPP